MNSRPRIRPKRDGAVTELIRNLIERYRKLLIALKLISNEVRKGLRELDQGQTDDVAIMHTHKLVAVGVPTTSEAAHENEPLACLVVTVGDDPINTIPDN